MPEYDFMPTTYPYLTNDQRSRILDEQLQEAGLTAEAAHRIENAFPDQLAQARRLEVQDLALQGSNLDADPQRSALFAQTITAQAHFDNDLSRSAAQVTGIPDAWSRYKAFIDHAGAELSRADITVAAFQGVSTADYLAERRDADRFVPTVTASELTQWLHHRLQADPGGPWHPDTVRESRGFLTYEDEYGSYTWDATDTNSGRYELEGYWAGEQLARSGAAPPQLEPARDATLTIYTTPTCPGCKLTKDKLAEAGVEFRSVDLSEHPELVEAFKEAGLLSAPIIETADGKRTAGFRPDRIKAIISTSTTSLQPSSAPASPPQGGAHRRPEQSRGRTL